MYIYRRSMDACIENIQSQYMKTTHGNILNNNKLDLLNQCSVLKGFILYIIFFQH